MDQRRERDSEDEDEMDQRSERDSGDEDEMDQRSERDSEDEEMNKKRELVSHLSIALKTTAKDVLLMLYRLKYPVQNPLVAPIIALKRTSQGKFVLKTNKAMEKTITANKVEEFDVTILFHLLKHTCGLKKNEKAWSNNTTLEGSIKIVHNLRNDNAHWTEAKCTLEELEKAWVDLQGALRNILFLAGFSVDHLCRVEEELRNIRKDDTPHKLQGRVRAELLSQYRARHKTQLQPLVWAGTDYAFHHSVTNTYTPIRITTLRHGEVTEVDVKDVLVRRDGSRVKVVQGDCGTGKTSLLRHLAASWAAETSTPSPAVSHLKYLLLLDLTAAAQGTFTVRDVIQEILPRTVSDWHATTIIKELAKAEENVLFMIDAFDERYDAFKDAFKELLKKCPNATFLVTTRPHCTQAILKLSESACKIVTTHGFGRKAAVDYATKVLQMNGKEDDVQDFISAISPYEEILTIPQLLCWSCWLWLKQGKQHVSSRSSVFANMTDFLLRKMCHINGKRVFAGKLPPEGQTWLLHVGRLAFILLQRDEISLTHSSTEIKKLEEEATKLKLRPHEALSTLMQCDSSMTGTGEKLVFQFVHESHACYLAAHCLVHHFRGNKKATLTPLLRNMNQKQQRLILLFLVGDLVSGQTDIPLQLFDDIAAFAQQFVSFFDITYYLDLLEESGYSQQLGRALSRRIPTPPGEEPLSLPSHTASYKRSLAGQLWLRPKELQRSKALRQILMQAKPVRLWLRFCDGPHNDELEPVSGHKDTKGNPDKALSLLASVYNDSHLPELRLTDCEFISTPDWPQTVWWLYLQRCNIHSRVSLPRGLLKLHLSECSDLEYLELHGCDTKSMCIEACTFTSRVRLPQNLQRLKVSVCSHTNLLSLPQNLKHFTFEGHDLPTLPHGLTSLHVSLDNIGGYVCKLMKQSHALIQQLEEAVQTLPSLRQLIITDMFIIPDTFMELLLEVQESCPRCHLRLVSYCPLKEDTRGVIKDTVNNSSLPSVKATFGDEVIKSSSSLEDLLRKL